MSEIRRLARVNKIFGSQVYAVAEETHLGLTTVRLASTGARLSNLYTVGFVEAGDPVIVEYGTDGVPYVRPTTIPEVEEEPLPIALVTAAEPPPDLPTPKPIMVGKVGRSTSQTIPPDTMSAILLTRKIFDPEDMSDGIGLAIQEDGTYMIHGTAAITNSMSRNTALFMRPSAELLIHYFEAGDVDNHLVTVCRRRSLGTGLIVLSCMGIMMLYSGERLQLSIYNNGFEASQLVMVTNGQYPILEAWKVSKLEGGARVIS